MVCRSSKEHKTRVWSIWWNDWGKHSDSDLHEWSWPTSTHIHLDQEEWSCRTEVRKGEDTHLQKDPFWGPWRVSLSSSQQDWSSGLFCCVSPSDMLVWRNIYNVQVCWFDASWSWWLTCYSFSFRYSKEHNSLHYTFRCDNQGQFSDSDLQQWCQPASGDLHLV